MTGFFELFLPATAFLLSLISLVVLYWIISRCQENVFMPIYYFLGLSIGAVSLMSLSRITNSLFGSHLFNYVLIEDLLISYIALFLFGALWESYETEVCVPPDFMSDE